MGFLDFFFGNKEQEQKEARLEAIQKEQEAEIKEQEALVKRFEEKSPANEAVLKPVEGVSCEDWAKCNALIVNNGDWTDEILEIINGDKAKWERVNTEWLARMAQDTDFAISNIYDAAFNASSVGSIDTIDENTFPFKKYVELTVANEVLTDQGKSPDEIFTIFDITLQDYLKIGEFWGQKKLEYSEKLSTFETIHEDDEYEAAEIARLNEAFEEDETFRQWAKDQEEWEEEFREKYSTADTTEDISF